MATISIKCSHVADGSLPATCVRCGSLAVVKQFKWVSDPEAASRYLSRRLKIWGLLYFWVFVLWKHYVRKEDAAGDAGLPFCGRHRKYWIRRAWFMAGGLVALVLFFGLAFLTDPTLTASGSRKQDPGVFTMMAGGWLLLYLIGFLVVHMSSMRVIRHDGQRVALAGVNRKFIEALKNLFPEYAAEQKPTHLQELRQMLSDFAR